jgi:D-sedoheptulose 7-phosphate isomerase
MLLQRIQQRWIDSADLHYQCAELLAPGLEAACHAMVAALTGGGKVLACGTGLSSTQAIFLTGALVSQLERERPELAAVPLGTSAAVIHGMRAGLDGQSLFARHVRALGVPGDVLFILTAQPATEDLEAAVQAAHERDMVVVALTAAKPGLLAEVMRDTDVLMSVPTVKLTATMELHQAALNSVLDGIDVLLLGEEVPEENVR